MCADTVLRQLPYYASTLVGRDDEIDLLVRLIQDPAVQVVTLTGTAGVGKTHLSSYVARIMERTCPDGAAFVSLAPVTNPALVPSEIAKALELIGDDLIDAIRARLGDWHGIVVLDNFEQVIESAPAIAAMLPHNPDFTFLITSQRPLHIAGERVVRLFPLAVPVPEADAEELRAAPSVKLLINRATEQDVTFAETVDDNSTTQAIAEICRKLDGIPLAIELAASRVATLSPEVVLAQLEQGQQILSSQRRDLPERQRTMHSAISWTYELLPPELQRVFLYLGAFTSGFNLSIAENVVEELGLETPAVDIISELFNFNLMRRSTAGADPWYVMLESIRAFCLAQLDAQGEREMAQAIVARHIVRLAEHTRAELTGPNRATWTVLLDRQRSTIRSVVSWALDHADPKVAMLVASGMSLSMEQDGRTQEALDWIDQALVWRDTLPEEVLIGGLIAKLTLLEDTRRLTEAKATADEIRPLLEGKDLPLYKIQFLMRSGNIAQDQQDFATAEGYYRQALALAEEGGFERECAIANSSMGFIAFFRGDYRAAADAFIPAKRILERLQDSHSLAMVLSNLAAAAINLGQAEEALEYLDQSILINRQTQSKKDLLYPLLNKAGTLIVLKEYEEAEIVGTEAVQLAREINHHMLEAIACITLADVSLVKKLPANAGEWLLQALAVTTPDEGTRAYAEIGWLVAHALAQQERYAEAAAMLAKSLAYAAENDVVVEETARERVEEVEQMVNAHLPNADRERQAGEAWTTRQYLRNLQWFAQRAASRNTPAASPFMMVTVSEPDVDPGFTPREREIVQLLTQGYSTRSMADHLSVSPRTITTHIANIMAKMEVSSRAELVAKVMRSGQ